MALLKRIQSEYGHTAAAKKARERLEQLGEGPPPEEEKPADEADPKSNLPPGFRPLDPKK